MRKAKIAMATTAAFAGLTIGVMNVHADTVNEATAKQAPTNPLSNATTATTSAVTSTTTTASVTTQQTTEKSASTSSSLQGKAATSSTQTTASNASDVSATTQSATSASSIKTAAATQKEAATSAAASAESKAATEYTTAVAQTKAQQVAESAATSSVYAQKINNQKQTNAATESAAAQKVATAQAALSSTAESATATPAQQTLDSDPIIYAKTAGHTISTEAQLPVVLTKPVVKKSDVASDYGYYGYINTNNSDKTAVVSTTGLTKQQQYELADYAVTLINSYRTAIGTETLKYNSNVEDATIAEAAIRNQEQLDFTHLSFNETEKAAFSAQGLQLDGENLGVAQATAAESKTTILALKVALLNAITEMVYVDDAHANGHLHNFVVADYMGVAVQANASMTYPYQLIFEVASAVPSSHVTQKTATARIKQAQASANQQYTAAKEAVASALIAQANLKLTNAALLNALVTQRDAALTRLATLQQQALINLADKYQTQKNNIQTKLAAQKKAIEIAAASQIAQLANANKRVSRIKAANISVNERGRVHKLDGITAKQIIYAVPTHKLTEISSYALSNETRQPVEQTGRKEAEMWAKALPQTGDDAGNTLSLTGILLAVLSLLSGTWLLHKQRTFK
ncbi:SEC10/PgrA surface exclusion domain-containing protein [Liquorilactobacillus satsumensis]|nr:SEC10/PgrA surface exclusion domain-containing protein [Liquorilactobacillus satsumensis]MCP9312473.1 SEC10/PgrA surface exclusion domain-containing protein [Liquorilactobacillus satsumensis]MCP9359763.1 SEC10/PgrA surface exclusion domain-containing protein [Liquorilactobacillus satsumensis]